MNQLLAAENLLGTYLRDRRTKLDPAALGFPAERRRTPGLRREEVAQRACISPTWYTWLEQGRGGAPSADVLGRIARALMLTDVEREHLFLLGLGRPPDARYRKNEGVTPRLQRVLDALDPSPALIRTATWDVVAWNRAATAMLMDYGSLPPEQRNMLRFIFLDPRARAHYDWKRGAARVGHSGDAARASAAADVQPLVDELNGSVRSSGDGGDNACPALMARLSNTSATRCSARSPSNSRCSRWTAERTSACWSTTRRRRRTPNGSRPCCPRPRRRPSARTSRPLRRASARARPWRRLAGCWRCRRGRGRRCPG